VGEDEEFGFGVERGTTAFFDVPRHSDLDLTINFSDIEVAGHSEDLASLEIFDDLTVDGWSVDDVVNKRLPTFRFIAGRHGGDVVLERFEARYSGEPSGVFTDEGSNMESWPR
jgi:hypothetical protein